MREMQNFVANVTVSVSLSFCHAVSFGAAFAESFRLFVQWFILMLCVAAAEESDSVLGTSLHERHSVKDINVQKIRDRANVSFFLCLLSLFFSKSQSQHFSQFVFLFVFICKKTLFSGENFLHSWSSY